MTRKLLQLLIAGLVIVLLYAWLNKTAPRQHSSDSVVLLNVPDSLKTEINGVVYRNDNVIGIQIITVHFQRNIQLDTYISIDDSSVREIYTRFLYNKVIETPFFNSDLESNQRLIRLINGDFFCIPYTDSTAGKLAPAAGEFIKTVCAIGIPPQRYGEFTGMLVIYLKDPPDSSEIDSLFLFARDLSAKIYDANKVTSEYRKQR